MKTVAVALVVLFLATPALADVTEQYKVRNAQDLVSLCGRDASAVDYVAAMNFCHGYTVGAYAYYHSVIEADPDAKIVCVKQPYPERKKVIADFVAWGKAHESFMKDGAVDTFFRFLVETFPCK
ncbi:MAG: hypothetical protein MUE57_10520 [Syntrophales bacterium]|jgi:hypothetical protein|nr:hypothetical protein [Syntrophales bacterium]MCU0584255.1 hypothetical protein [Syntrophales bacterium]